MGSLKAMLEDPPITPLTYKIPDYWKSGELSQHGSPVFLSSSKRFSEIHESSAEPIVELKVTNSISKSGYSRTPEIGSLNNLRRPKSSQQILLSKVKGYSFSRKDLKSSPSSIMMAENFDESAKVIL